MKASQGRLGLATLAALVLLPCIACGGHDTHQVIAANVRLSINSYTTDLDQGGTKQFTASVTGTSNTNVVWSIQEGSLGGSINSQGLYTAPFQSGVVHVIATSVADSSKSASAVLYVRSVNISITPQSGDMEPGETQQFAANVSGTVVPDLIWKVSDNTCGTVTASGLYTAPPSQGTCLITATNTKDPTATSSVSVRVTPVAVAIAPKAAALVAGATRQFYVSVAGTLEDSVAWSVQEGATGGTISDTGLYTAPAKLGEYHVLASSLSHPGMIGIAKVSVVTSRFSETGSMANARGNPTATLLPTGEVLIVGGYGFEVWESQSSAEIYNPATGTFRTTGSMNTGRDGHTATPLLNGKILIVGGGITDWVSYNSAELYDPATGLFTPTGSMSARRTHHTATRLQNGKVLIVGGADWAGDSQPTSAELYDPETGTFTPAGAQETALWGHTAMLLDDNRVLIIGGTYDYYYHSTADVLVYDPQTSTFTKVASLSDPRSGHQSTPLANTVLVTGGFTTIDSDWRELIYDEAELYDITSHTVKPQIEMELPRLFHTSTLMQNGQVLITGGYSGNDLEGWWNTTDSVELFDPASSTFTSVGPMKFPRVLHTATLLKDGRVLIVGGNSGKAAELYTPQ